MRSHGYRLLAWALVVGLTLSACADEQSADNDEEDDLPTNQDVTAPLEDLDTLTEGAPDNDELRQEARADETFPASHDLLETQSPVSDQGGRGICSVFATVGLMEHLYIKAEDKPNPEFSEQYLQWSAKKEVGSFPNSSGSNARSNIDAISQYGVVEEELWEYEDSPWGAQDDEECQGSDRPTYCYTNGNPPEEAVDAPKYKLPSGRWISTRTRDIKAHMYNKGEGVQVGGDFYYQAWNHGGSSLPTNQDYWREGYVLYPNDDDIEASLEDRVGHSILLVGWDDNLEVERVDGDGEVIVDEDGEPETEQGFFIFKNSWGTGSFGVNNPHGDGYGFISYDYVEEFKTGRVAGTPEPEHVPDEVLGDDPECTTSDDCDGGKICNDEVCVAECEDDQDCRTGETCEANECVIDGCDADSDCEDGEICDDSVCVAECTEDWQCELGDICIDEECVPGCYSDFDCPADDICIDDDCVAEDDAEATDHTYEYTGGEQTIPDGDEDGVTTEIEVDNPGEIQDLDVDVLVEHSRNGYIQIDLTHPSGQEVELHNADGTFGEDVIENFEVDEFDGLEAEGTWELTVAAIHEHEEGTLVDWTLYILH